jgi:group I intron endonuclease
MANLHYRFKYYFIYKITNLLNKKCYVGFHATNSEYDKDLYFGSSKTLDNAIKKYGMENFIMGVIEYVNVNEWKEKERFWIKEMHAHVSLGGYNLTWGGDGTLGLTMSNESRKKMSYIQKNRSELTKQRISESIKKWHHDVGFSAQTKEKISNTHKQNTKLILLRQTAFLGKHHTDETKKKISAIHKGKKLSDETKEKIRSKLIGIKLSDETKLKISISNMGKKRTDKTKERYRISKLGKKRAVKTCPYCNKNIGDGNYERWHGENCKLKISA